MRLLLVTETPPCTPNGFGVTLKCLFKEIPHHVIYTDFDFKSIGDNLGYTFAQVPYHNSKKFLFSLFLGKIPEWRSQYSSKWLHRNIDDNFTIVYAFIYSTECLKYAHWIANKKQIPLVVHLADFSPKFECRHPAKILLKASKLVCITEEMKSIYEQTLGRKDIEVLHNGAEDTCAEIAPPQVVKFSKKKPFLLCFIGSLFSHLHGQCIEDLFEAVSQVRKKIPWLEFHLYGQRQPAHFLDDLIHSDGFTHHGIVMPLNKKFEIMEKAHSFVIPSSFNDQKHLHYRYSFPTKLPELIASGRPILSYGPKETSTNRILEANNIGLRVNDRSVPKLVDAIENIVNKYEDNVSRLAAASPTLIEKFSADSVRRKLRKIVSFN